MNHRNEKLKNMDWVIRLRHPITKIDSLRLTTEIKSLMLKIQQCHG
ncbi:MAG: hypothetical protein OEX11_08435 [Nitrosomonas sp.]|nr:hypothetical protein [Nitrosomonas sp.]